MSHTDVIRGENPEGNSTLAAQMRRARLRLNRPDEIRPWTTSEVATLRKMAPLGAQAIASMLERSTKAVRRQAERLRISLRTPGEVRGRILGQPRGVSFARDRGVLGTLREDVLAGRVDPALIERRAQLLAAGAPLCPSCAVRPVEVESTGWCTPCHLRDLAEAHAMEADRITEQRHLDAERQRKHRRKEAVSA
jgi:hypothetical protein